LLVVDAGAVLELEFEMLKLREPIELELFVVEEVIGALELERVDEKTGVELESSGTVRVLVLVLTKELEFAKNVP